MKKVILGLALLAISLQASNALALTKAEQDYLTVDTITVQQIPDETPLAIKSQTFQNESVNSLAFQDDGGDSPLAILDMIIGIGKRIWIIAEKNKPVVGAEENFVSAVPFGIQDPSQLTGWQPTKSYSYNIIYKNLFRINIVNFSYRVVFTYGGNVQGKGRYLTGATIARTYLDVGWGYRFKSHVEVPTIVNIGTKDEPVAGMQMNLVWSVDTILKHNEMRASYFIDGHGGFRILQ